MATALVMLFASCGEGKKSGIQPADPAITYGTYEEDYDWKDTRIVNVPLDGCLEVQKVSAVVVPGKEHSSIDKQINVTIEVKMVKAPSMKIDECGGASIQLLNEDGAVLQECYADYRGVKELLQLSVGGIATLTGHTKEDGGGIIQELFDQIKYIRLINLSGGHKENKESSKTSEEEASDDDDSDEETVSNLSTSNLEDVANNQMKKAEEIANKQMKKAEEIANRQMEKAERIANEQMEEAERQARKALGL